MTKRKPNVVPLSDERRREIAQMGGRAVHEKGVGRQWTAEEARAQGARGGAVARARGVVHVFTAEERARAAAKRRKGKKDG